MYNKEAIFPLLESVVQDNYTFKFPVEIISKELTSLFLEPLEFDYFMIQSYRKLKREFGEVVAHIFLSTADLKLNLKDRDIYSLTTAEYQVEIENFLTTLENLYITKIDKKSSDGEMMSAMA
jgi:hypothetical protein